MILSMNTKLARIALLAGALTLLTACVPTLHPYYKPSQLIFDPALAGKWSADNSSDSWEFRKSGDKAYTLIYTDKNGVAGHFDAHLFKLGDLTLLDLFPNKETIGDLEAPDIYHAHILPTHTLIVIRSVGPTLMMGFMNAKWLDEYLAANPDALPHASVKNRTILTGTTEQLQAFLQKHGSEEGFFTRPMDLLPE